ncbi:hypothetical protein [Candidatus Accumulibacter sp. ACC012]|uniref:hypothetical protein n=1 Tax=Candidatus Accumulibacter sp. ACC012 TaxID=2823332 RepID=UPI0025BDD84D|nr:hypothetical protein [Candidatus Accumulibacter sp. ACC012]
MDFRSGIHRLWLSEKTCCAFGEFTTKAGRLSPYFFNADCSMPARRCSGWRRFYATAITSVVSARLFVWAGYKGIPLVAVIAVALARACRNLPFAFNRKEAKDHGEGGSIVGAPLAGQVLIVDDVFRLALGARIGRVDSVPRVRRPVAW